MAIMLTELAHAPGDVFGASVHIGPKHDGGHFQLVKCHQGFGDLTFALPILGGHWMLSNKPSEPAIV